MKWIKPSRICGTLSAPPSKSMTIRAVAAALLTEGRSCLQDPSLCKDALAGISIAESLGAKVRREGDLLWLSGRGIIQETTLACHESGLCMRMFAPIAALRSKKIILSGTGSIASRPMGIVEDPLHQLGVECKTNGGFAPIEVKGPLRPGKVFMDGSVSSQLLTGLLFALPICDGPSEIEVLNLKSTPYVAMTLAILKQFGVSVAPEKSFKRFIIKGNQRYMASSYQVEGDWSGAAFLLIAGAISGKVTVKNLQADSSQADKRILEVLDSVKAKVSITEGAVSVEKNELRAFDFDATDCPDLIPPVVALACHCTGRSVIYGMDRLKHKESDRSSVLLSEFVKIGARIAISGNQMEIEGKSLKGGHVDTHNDHRIAMAGAIAGLNSEEGVIISGWTCVSKSYPGFFSDLRSIKGDPE